MPQAQRQQLAPIDRMWRSLARPLGVIAKGTSLDTHQEREFLRAQVEKHWQIKKGVEDGNEVTIQSVKDAARESFAMGLSMSTNASLVYFIPRRARRKWDNETDADYKRNVAWVVTATPSYRGLSYIACNYAGAELLAAEVVYEADDFDYYGPITQPRHKQTTDAKLRGEGHAIGAYAVAVMRSGIVRAHYVDVETIYKIRGLSDNSNGLMWTKVWTEGWCKVPIRRICKLVMGTHPRMQAADLSLNTYEGIVLDPNDEEERPAPEVEASATKPERPVTGLDAIEHQASETLEFYRDLGGRAEDELEPVTVDQHSEPEPALRDMPIDPFRPMYESAKRKISEAATLEELDAAVNRMGTIAETDDTKPGLDDVRRAYTKAKRQLEVGE